MPPHKNPEYDKAYYDSHVEERKSYNKAHAEKHRIYQKAYRLAHSAERKAYMLSRNYGLSESEYLSMIERQGGACAICKRADVDLHIDHNHKTSAVRGLLCPPCNWGIGHLQDNIDILRSAIEYLSQDE